MKKANYLIMILCCGLFNLKALVASPFKQTFEEVFEVLDSYAEYLELEKSYITAYELLDNITPILLTYKDAHKKLLQTPLTEIEFLKVHSAELSSVHEILRATIRDELKD
jgi:hypothetical protein